MPTYLASHLTNGQNKEKSKSIDLKNKSQTFIFMIWPNFNGFLLTCTQLPKNDAPDLAVFEV